MKKAIAFLLIFIMMLGAFPAYADDISVYVNGSKVEFDVQPQIINGRTMVPMRKIFEALGAVVSWDSPSQTATGKKDDIVVNVSIDSTVLFKNGSPKVLDVAPCLIDGRTLVPARAIAESFDCTVDWDDRTRTVVITSGDGGIFSKATLTASEIAERVSPSVFYVEVYDSYGTALGSGSGVFVSSDGVAVTNYHVIEDTSSARITLIDGQQYDVTNIIAYDSDLDVAIIRVSKTSVSGKTVSGFSSVSVADSDNIKAGQTVYALGSPVGLQNTISDGIISNVKQQIDENTFIQITAPISPGSSGGALVNEYGEVLGITSAGFTEAQNIGFAIPINVLQLFDLTAHGISYQEFVANSGEFTLEIYPEVIEISVGETAEVYVYAEGKTEDWSIYWNAGYTNLVSCEWGDWLVENESVCPLRITGLRPGTETITVYSDVDFKGKYITVHITGPKIETYASSIIPTYTAVTGVRQSDYTWRGGYDIYIYDYYNISVVQSYVDYLLANGFEYYDEERSSGTIRYFYIAPDGSLFALILDPEWKQVRIMIKGY